MLRCSNTVDDRTKVIFVEGNGEVSEINTSTLVDVNFLIRHRTLAPLPELVIDMIEHNHSK